MKTCKLCGGRVDKMGKLAFLVWFICRNCGMLSTKQRRKKLLAEVGK